MLSFSAVEAIKKVSNVAGVGWCRQSRVNRTIRSLIRSDTGAVGLLDLVGSFEPIVDGWELLDHRPLRWIREPIPIALRNLAHRLFLFVWSTKRERVIALQNVVGLTVGQMNRAGDAALV